MPVRQRNDTDHSLFAHTDPPQVIEPGQVITYPVHVIGLTVVTTEPAGTPSTAEPTKSARRNAKEATQ